MELSTSKQVSICLIASGNMITSGMTVAYPAVALPAMMESTSGLNLTDLQTSWIASLSQLAMIMGSVVIGPLLEWKGRKLGLILSGFSAVLGWTVIGMMPHSLGCLYVGRLLVGIASGFGGASTSVFMAEVTSPKIRGALTVTKNTAFSTGLTLMYIIGMLFKDDWGKMALVGAVVPTVYLLLTLVCLPESKVWQQSNQRNKTKHSYSELFKAYKTRPEVYKPINIMNALLILRQLSGTSVILSYAVSLVKLTGVQGDPHVVTVVLGVTRILAGLIACLLSGWIGRRIPVSWSGAIMSITMLWLARNVKLKFNNVDESNYYSDTIVLIIFMLTSTIYTSICQALVGEVFPTDVRGLCTGLSTCFTFLTSFVTLMLYPVLVNLLGQPNLFFMYGTFCVAGTLLAILTLPETKNRTLTEIQALFVKKQTSQVETKDPVQTQAEIELLVIN